MKSAVASKLVECRYVAFMRFLLVIIVAHAGCLIKLWTSAGQIAWRWVGSTMEISQELHDRNDECLMLFAEGHAAWAGLTGAAPDDGEECPEILD